MLLPNAGKEDYVWNSGIHDSLICVTSTLSNKNEKVIATTLSVQGKATKGSVLSGLKESPVPSPPPGKQILPSEVLSEGNLECMVDERDLNDQLWLGLNCSSRNCSLFCELLHMKSFEVIMAASQPYSLVTVDLM